MIWAAIKQHLEVVYRYFCDVEEENQELFQSLKNTLMTGVTGFAVVATFVMTAASQAAKNFSLPLELILYGGIALLVIYVGLVLWRSWERVKFEYTSPYSS